MALSWTDAFKVVAALWLSALALFLIVATNGPVLLVPLTVAVIIAS